MKIRWQPLWIFAGNESFDPNSGLSFYIVICVMSESGQFQWIELSLCKPQIYGLWHCLWNHEKHIHQLISRSIKGVIAIDIDMTEFAVIPLRDYYPFPHIFQLKPHCIHSEQMKDILLHIDKSVIPLNDENLFFTSFLFHHIQHVESLFDVLEDVLSISLDQKKILTNKWTRMIIKNILFDQREEYDISL